MAPVLALSASILSIGASMWYNIDLFRGRIRPNLSSWLVWTFITVLSSTSYFIASDDPVKALFAFTNSAACAVTFGIILWRGRFSSVGRADAVAATIGVFAGLLWLVGRSAAWGNLVLQLAIVVGCIPTYRSVLRAPSSEKPGPWLLWGLTFALAVIVVLMRWSGKPLDLVYPVVGLVLYSGIGVLALRRMPVQPMDNGTPRHAGAVSFAEEDKGRYSVTAASEGSSTLS